ncbi:MAG: glycosyltransferase [Clostridia bacterium]|nr:glycosyltransferase [Clostridia bacterium]
MTITVVCDVLGKENNGTTIAAMNLIRALRERGHSIRTVCSDPERKGESGFYVVPRLNVGPFNRYVAKNGVALSRPDRAVIDSALEGADRVHIMIPLALGTAAAKAARKKGIPITAGFHCQAENLTGHLFLKNVQLANRIAYRVFYRKLYRYCDLIHYPTQFICDTFEAEVGPTPHRVISNGVNKCFVPREAVKPDEFKGRYVVLFIGRYGPEKNHEVLIDAAALSRHRDEIQLVFAGDGPRREKIIRRAEKKGIPMPVMKFYDRETLIDIINCADLYVHPAEIEIEAIACLEAIACGRVPLIADSPRSATRYFALTGRNLFHFNDPKDLAERMDWWLDHPEERRACSEKYLGYARQFDYDSCMDRMEQMIIDAGDMHREA